MSVQIKGLQPLINRISRHAKEITPKVDKALSSHTLKMRSRAVNAAPVDEGQLRRSIVADVNKPLQKSLSASAFYAPYIEFGTKTKVKVPPELEEYALQFKGLKREGDFEEMVKRLAEWVRRKGLAGLTQSGRRRKGKKARLEELAIARVIAYHIIRKGIRPQPFFFPAMEAETDPMIQEIMKAIGFTD